MSRAKKVLRQPSASLLPKNITGPAHQFKCIIAYDGTNYNGFQAQETVDTPTVQEAIEDAILRTTGEVVRIRACSRTDRGVHARGQVIVFDSQCSVDGKTLGNALNSRLDDAISCLQCVKLSINSDRMDPRKLSIGKEYEYRIVSGGVRPVQERFHVWFVRQLVDIRAMKEAAQLILHREKRDYASFSGERADAKEGTDTFCILHALDITLDQACQEEINHERQLWIRIRISGDRFLYKMVRNIVGTLVDVGLGKIDASSISQILLARDRRQAGQGAPAKGLTLVRVYFP